jgi:hypothetical protein
MSKYIYLKAEVKGGEFELFTFLLSLKFWLVWLMNSFIS